MLSPQSEHDTQPFDEGRPGRLTLREQEVLRCLSLGMTTIAISEDLGISSVTVRNHIQNILRKLRVHTKLAAAAFAYRNRLFDIPAAPEPSSQSE